MWLLDTPDGWGKGWLLAAKLGKIIISAVFEVWKIQTNSTSLAITLLTRDWLAAHLIHIKLFPLQKKYVHYVWLVGISGCLIAKYTQGG